MKRDEATNNVPFQVQHLLELLKNKDETIYIRNNYRARLDDIRKVIEKALKEYDLETVGPPVRKSKGR